MKYVGPFLLNGILYAIGSFYANQSAGLGGGVVLLLVLGIGLLLNMIAALVYFWRYDLRVGFLYIAFFIYNLLPFYTISSQFPAK
jgi:hypothetical protein